MGALLGAAILAGTASPAHAACAPTGCPGGGGGITFWSLTVTLDGPGTASDGLNSCAANPCDDWLYRDGLIATPSAAAASGYRFTGWSGDCTGTTCSLAMNTNHVVTAHFGLQSPVITSPSAGTKLISTTGGGTTISFTPPLPTATTTCKVDTRTAVPCTSPYHTPSLSTGTHTVVVTASDGTRTAAATRDWKVIDLADTKDIAGTPRQDDHVFSRHTSFDLSGTNSPDEFQCRLDGGLWRDCNDTVALDAASFTPGGALAGGAHTLDVRAGVVFEATHYFDTTPASVSWTVLEPDTALGGGPADGAFIRQNDTSFTFSDPTGGADAFRCSLDGAPSRGCTSPLDVAAQLNGGQALADGVHTLDVWGTHTDGSETVADPTPVHRAWTVDTVAPGASITNGPAAGLITNQTTAAFGFAASEPAVTFACSLDGAAFAACPAAMTLRGLSAASHVLRVRAADRAGNTGPEVSRSWRVIGGTPTTTVTPPDTHNGDARPAGPTSHRPPKVRVSYGFAIRHHRTRFLKLAVRGIPRHGKVRLTCHGGRHKGCRLAHRKIRIRHGRADLLPQVRRARLEPGAWLDIRVSARGMTTRVVRITVRRSKAPHMITRCVKRGSKRLRRCS